jgi:hypothetical protein
MIREKMTPMIGRGAPAARARTTAQHKMSRDWTSSRGLKRAIYEEPVFLMMPFAGRRCKDFNTVCQVLNLPSSVRSESVIGRVGYQGNG